MREKKDLGDWGEEMAADYLTGKGYQILDRQYHSRFGEADLVAKKDEQLIFIEVKTRKTHMFGLPETALNFWKKRKLYKTALAYLAQKDINTENFRLDLIAIDLNADQPQIRHYENISAGI